MGRKSKVDVRRKEILQTCYELIESDGLEGITLKKIGKKMGVAPSLIMHYFTNKEELIGAVVDHMLEKMDSVYIPRLSQFGSARERLEFFLEETINLYIAQSVSDQVWYPCFALSMHDSKIRDAFRRAYERDLKMSRQLFTEYIEEEGLEGVDPEVWSAKLISFVEGLNLLHAVYGMTGTFKAAIRDLKKDFLSALDNRQKN